MHGDPPPPPWVRTGQRAALKGLCASGGGECMDAFQVRAQSSVSTQLNACGALAWSSLGFFRAKFRIFLPASSERLHLGDVWAL